MTCKKTCIAAVLVAACGLAVAFGQADQSSPALDPDTVIDDFAATADELRDVVDELKRILASFDGNGDDRLDASERDRLEAHVADNHGRQWISPLRTVLQRADSSGDGILTSREWENYTGPQSADELKDSPTMTVMISASDGVNLATDVYLPEGDGKGPWPVILRRTPYDKSRSGFCWPDGIVNVLQDQRGRFASEGWNFPFVGCGWDVMHDGLDTVDWIRAQPWCDGRVFTLGASAVGITQHYLAAAKPQGLEGQYIVVAAVDLYRHAVYVGGAFRKSQVEGWATDNQFDPQTVRTCAAHPSYDRFWSRFDALAKQAAIDVPAVHVGGWFDTFALGTVDGFRSRQHHGGPRARGKQKLVMGPWKHSVDQPVEISSGHFPDYHTPELYREDAWRASQVLGRENGFEQAPAVAYYVMGDVDDPGAPGNQWRFADDWPPACEPTAFYFHADGGLSKETPSEGNDAAAYVEYTFDPTDPCPTQGGCNLCIEAGPKIQNDVEARDDVITFTTEPLAAPIEVTGHPRVQMFLSSSAVDTDLSVRISDVYPDGKSYLMAEGMLRFRYRESSSEPNLMEPGEIYDARFECWPTSVVFNQGHRIRIAVTSSNYPRFDLNPGTGETWDRRRKAVKQINRLHCNTESASRIVLPVIAAPLP